MDGLGTCVDVGDPPTGERGVEGSRPLDVVGAALTCLVQCYLSVFRSQAHAALLWFEYWIHCARTGRLAELATSEHQVLALLDAAMTDDRLPHSADTAHEIYVVLLGSIVDQTTRPSGPTGVPSQIAAVLDREADR